MICFPRVEYTCYLRALGSNRLDVPRAAPAVFSIRHAIRRRAPSWFPHILLGRDVNAAVASFFSRELCVGFFFPLLGEGLLALPDDRGN